MKGVFLVSTKKGWEKQLLHSKLSYTFLTLLFYGFLNNTIPGITYLPPVSRDLNFTYCFSSFRNWNMFKLLCDGFHFNITFRGLTPFYNPRPCSKKLFKFIWLGVNIPLLNHSIESGKPHFALKGKHKYSIRLLIKRFQVSMFIQETWNTFNI